MMLSRERASVEEGRVDEGTSEEGTERGMDAAARERGEEASGGGIERGREGARE